MDRDDCPAYDGPEDRAQHSSSASLGDVALLGPLIVTALRVCAEAETAENLASRFAGWEVVAYAAAECAALPERDLREVLREIEMYARRSRELLLEDATLPTASSGFPPTAVPAAGRSHEQPMATPASAYRTGREYVEGMLKAAQAQEANDSTAARRLHLTADSLLGPLGDTSDCDELRDFIAGAASAVDDYLRRAGVPLACDG